MYYLEFSTSKRHNRIVGAIYGNIYNTFIELIKKDEINPLIEEAALVHYGRKNRNEILQLIDVESIDRDSFIDVVIDDLEYVQPDFILFKDNKYVENRRETRIAGQPDLIIEVWSSSNSEIEKQEKFKIYSSSKITEHWYINQDHNIIQCFLGEKRLNDQNLKNVLVTQNGIEFDLRYLALK